MMNFGVMNEMLQRCCRVSNSVGFLKNNGLVMPHDTKINAIFMGIKTGDCPITVRMHCIYKFSSNKFIEL